MNLNPLDTAYQPLQSVNPQSLSAQQLQFLAGQLNNLILQFNELVNGVTNLSSVIASLQAAAIPYDGNYTHNSRFINNADLLNWPGPHPLIVGQTISGTNYPQITITPGTNAAHGSTVFASAAGYVEIDDGNLYLDSAHHYGVNVSSSNLVLTATGGLVKTAVNLEVDGGYLFLDAAHNYGVASFSSNLVLSAIGGVVQTAQNVEVDGGNVYLNSAHTIGIGTNGTDLTLTTLGWIILDKTKIVPTTNSTSTLAVYQHGGTVNVFDVDTTNKRVGINNGTPAYDLDVAGNCNLTGWLTSNDIFTQYVMPQGGDYVNAIMFRKNSGAAGTTILNLDTVNRRIGINTEAPSSDLHIAGAASNLVMDGSNAQITMAGAYSQIQATHFFLTTIYPIADGVPGGGGGGFWFTNHAGGTYGLCVDTTNNRIGINNGTPSYSLDVTGTANVSSDVTFGSTLIVTSTIQTSGYFRGQVYEGTSAGHFVTIRPYSGVGHTDSTSGVLVSDSSGNAVCTFDTTNRIVYPAHLVIPTS